MLLQPWLHYVHLYDLVNNIHRYLTGLHIFTNRGFNNRSSKNKGDFCGVQVNYFPSRFDPVRHAERYPMNPAQLSGRREKRMIPKENNFKQVCRALLVARVGRGLHLTSVFARCKATFAIDMPLHACILVPDCLAVGVDVRAAGPNHLAFCNVIALL